MGRPPCCDKSNVKRGLWTAEEDAKILAHVSKHGTGNWTLVPKKAGLNRCGKSCRLRWTNYLRPDLNHDDFTPQEELHIINLHQVVGSRWSLIAKQLPGRTDNDVKNYWNTKLRKKLSKMGIDPLTHKPFSQIFSEFGSITAARPDPTTLVASPDAIVTVHQRLFDACSSTSSPSPSSSSSSSSSSSHYSFQHQTLNWTDFLVHDLVVDPLPQTDQGLPLPMNSGSDSTVLIGNQPAVEYYDNNKRVLENQPVSSFVDAILDRDIELRSEFPDFLDESLDYYY